MNFIRKRLGLLPQTTAIMEIYEFEQSNEVIYLYRRILKQISFTYERRLERMQKLKEAQWIFRECKDEKDQEQIKYLKKQGYIVLQMLEQNKVLPSFYPNPLDLADPEVYNQFGKQLYNRVKF
ncbi:unnamed protein product [Paramecium sonneborni]|uniref:Uncharacterized protein n=1 Tax=Paramecium sonneborni TaxID=65129 RepID=A0A8S1MUB2_9CILI|nr:unnamed protein product [Paramecium sonneborni]